MKTLVINSRLFHGQYRQRCTYGPIIDQCNLHHGPEYAIFDAFLSIQLTYSEQKIVVQLASFIPGCCTMEVGFIPLFDRAE